MADINQSTSGSPASSPQGTGSGMPKIAGMNFENKKFWMIFGGIAAVVLIIIVVFMLISGGKKEVVTQPTPDLAKKSENQSPVALPAIVETEQNRTQINQLKVYLTGVSTNFRDEFMANIPENTLGAYKKYIDAPAGDAKLEAARAFYIYLNNPGKYKDDPSYKLLIKDVRTDLEKTLGRALFTGQ